MEHPDVAPSRPTGREPPKGAYTWDDFIALPDDDRRELIDGELVEVEVPTEAHEKANAALIAYLFFWVEERGGRVLSAGYKVKISERRGVMPDVQVFLAGNTATRTAQGLIQGAPDLAVEIISDSSARYDRITKLGWYARIGCPEYWIVDPELRTLERLVLKDGRYSIMNSLSEIEVFKPDSFPGLEIPLAKLWIAQGAEPSQN